MRLALSTAAPTLLFACLLSGAAACPPSGEPGPPLSAAELAPSTALSAAFEALDAERLQSDLTWIAADARGGRDTPSEGLEQTARFLAERMESEGFQPAAREGFLYRYPLTWRQLDLGASHLSVTRGEAAGGQGEGGGLTLRLDR